MSSRPSNQLTPALLVLPLLFICSSVLYGHTGFDIQTSVVPSVNTVTTSRLREEVNDFLERELTVHLAAIKTFDPAPDRVLGVPTTGEFSWGTFMRSLAAYADTTGKKELAGRDLAKAVGQIGLIEARKGSKAFSQLYAALALRHFGRDLKTNPLWLGLSDEERKAWLSLLNPERFYDPKTNRVIDLAENYLGVAARIASIGYELGIAKDRAFLDRLIDRAAVQFTSGALYADDAPPTGRFDRYSMNMLVTFGKRPNSRIARTSWTRYVRHLSGKCVCGGISSRKTVTATTGEEARAWLVTSTHRR